MLVLSVSYVYKTGDSIARFPPPEGLLAQKNKGALCDMNSLFCRKNCTTLMAFKHSENDALAFALSFYPLLLLAAITPCQALYVS